MTPAFILCLSIMVIDGDTLRCKNQLMLYVRDRPLFLDEAKRDRPELFAIFERSA